MSAANPFREKRWCPPRPAGLSRKVTLEKRCSCPRCTPRLDVEEDVEITVAGDHEVVA